MKKLYRSDTNKIFAGILGGIGEYYNTDPVIIRMLYIILLILTGGFPMLVAYIIALLVIPEKPRVEYEVVMD